MSDCPKCREYSERVNSLQEQLKWEAAVNKALLECQERYVPENARLREALEYQARVNHGYSYLAQAALDGKSLDEGQLKFLEWARKQARQNYQLSESAGPASGAEGLDRKGGNPPVSYPDPKEAAGYGADEPSRNSSSGPAAQLLTSTNVSSSPTQQDHKPEVFNSEKSSAAIDWPKLYGLVFVEASALMDSDAYEMFRDTMFAHRQRLSSMSQHEPSIDQLQEKGPQLQSAEAESAVVPAKESGK